jgi:hypothetical protein
MASPDVAGFRAAQARLREVLGVDAVFIIASALTWPPDTPLDPETGRPYDPFLEPVTPEVDVQVTVRCSFVQRPLVAADPTLSPIGSIDRGSAALVVAEADQPAVKDAVRVIVGRWIAYLEHA